MINAYVLEKTGQFYTDIPSHELQNILRDEKRTVWVDFESASAEENNALTEVFKFHPLAVEDCINTSEHPKLDKYDGYMFVVLHAINFGRKKNEELSTLELNLFIAKNYIVTYHRKPIRSIIATREQCVQDPNKVLGDGTDFLMHKIVDAVVDNYLPTISLLEHEIESLEDDIFEDCDQELLNKILTLKKDAMYLKKVISQQRNTVYRLANTDFPLIGKDSQIYFSDIYDQLYKFVDQLENYKDLLNGTVDLYLSMSSVKMNEIMKTLTVVMTILMPMTLITGIYGMNFKNMPEINSPHGYFITLGIMIFIGLLLWSYMKRKKWF
ncbi:magnesium/cobalt transporter CorA [Candidatus Omnitrophota bacterium]